MNSVNIEHQLKSKLAWPVCWKSMILNKNGTEAMTKAKNQAFIGLWFENFYLGVRGGRVWRGGIFGWWWGDFLPSPQYGKPCVSHCVGFPLPLNAVTTSGLRHYIQNQKVLGSKPTRFSACFTTQPRYKAHGDPLFEISHMQTVCIGVSTRPSKTPPPLSPL